MRHGLQEVHRQDQSGEHNGNTHTRILLSYLPLLHLRETVVDFFRQALRSLAAGKADVDSALGEVFLCRGRIELAFGQLDAAGQKILQVRTQ